MINIEVHSTHAVIRTQQPLTVGLRGASAHFTFGDPWEQLIKTAVFRQGDKTVTVPDIGQQVEIPCEVLTQPGVPVMIGAYGIDSEGKLVIPTLWAETEPVQPGADPDAGVSPADPTASVWARLQSHMGSLEHLQTNDKTSLVAAVNEVNRPVLVIEVVDNGDGTYRSSHTFDEITSAMEAGVPLVCYWYDKSILLYMTDYQDSTSVSVYAFTAVSHQKEYCVAIKRDGVNCSVTELSEKPKKLTFIGNATAEYDGSEEVTVGIPTKVSQLQNDSGFLTEVPAPVYLVTINDSNKAGQSYSDRLAAYQSGYVLQCDYLGYRLPLKAIVDMDLVFSGTIESTSYHVVVRSNGSTVIKEHSLASKTDIPKKLSELIDDSNFLIEAPVTSVNGQTGDVTLPTTLMVTVTKQADGSYVSNKTVAELRTALNAGETLRCWYYDDDAYLPLTYCHGGFTFSAAVNQYLYQVTINAGGNSETKVLFTKTELSSGGGANGLLLDQETGMLYLMKDGQIMGTGVQLPTAEGGPTNNAVLTLENTTGWAEKTVANDAACMISFNWSSIEGGVSTGSGTVTVKVNQALKYSAAIKQGEHSVDISQYLSLGENLVHVTVTDFYGNSQSIPLGVTVYDPAALKSTKLVERTLTGDYTNDRVTKVGNSAFADVTLGRLDLPNVTEFDAFSFAGLTADEVELPSTITTVHSTFRDSTIGVMKLPKVLNINDSSFYNATITRLILNSTVSIESVVRGARITTYDCHKLSSLSCLPVDSGAYNLIIRTPNVCTLQAEATNTLATLYVPSDLVGSYQSATNWSAMADRIFAIEQYPEICEVNENV